MPVQRDTLSQDLSSGAMSESLTFPTDVEIVQILFSASTNITETITISFDSADGSTWDTILETKTLSSEADFVYRPFGQPVIPKEDQLNISVTNANTTGTIRVTVLTEARA